MIRALFERQTAVPKRSKRRPRDAQEEVPKSQTFPKWSPQSGPCILVSVLFGNLVGIADLNPDLHICLDVDADGRSGRGRRTRTVDADADRRTDERQNLTVNRDRVPLVNQGNPKIFLP